MDIKPFDPELNGVLKSFPGYFTSAEFVYSLLTIIPDSLERLGDQVERMLKYCYHIDM